MVMMSLRNDQPQSKLHDTVWHKWLRRPYRLACITDSGVGVPVVMLHGLGRHAGTWQHVVEELQGRPYRLLAFDLLGFGASPKPDWINYTVDDHVHAVIASLKKYKISGPVILVGHSMGCLISVRIAKLYPELVRHLVLYEMPLYSGLPETKLYRLRLDFYFGLYKRIIAYKPAFGGKTGRTGQKLVEKLLDIQMTPDIWRSFVRSLEHTIMDQRTSQDVRAVAAPIDVIYGSRDRLVIRGETKLLFGQDVKNITAHTIRESHRVSPKASKFLVERIEAAASNSTQAEIKAGRPLHRRLTLKKLQKRV